MNPRQASRLPNDATITIELTETADGKVAAIFSK